MKIAVMVAATGGAGDGWSGRRVERATGGAGDGWSGRRAGDMVVRLSGAWPGLRYGYNQKCNEGQRETVPKRDGVEA